MPNVYVFPKERLNIVAWTTPYQQGDHFLFKTGVCVCMLVQFV